MNYQKNSPRVRIRLLRKIKQNIKLYYIVGHYQQCKNLSLYKKGFKNEYYCPKYFELRRVW